MMNELKAAIAELENHLQFLKNQYGDTIYEMRDLQGNYLVTPILTALVNGYAALVNRDQKP